MSLLTVINLMQETLQDAGAECEVAGYRELNASGALDIPEAEQFVIYVITDVPRYEWGKLKYSSANLQLNSFAGNPGKALANLEVAQPLLIAEKFIPLPVVSLGRNATYAGFGQRFERGH